ncbi:MAG: anthranilate phosphoribosyltransferase [Acidimicrobiales bacterium]
MGVFVAAGAWPGVLAELSAGRDLSADVARSAMECILEGAATPAQIAAFIVALRVKGESPAEVAGLVDAMLEAAAPLDLADPDGTVDLVGTGGSTPLRGRAFNVSTMASLVAAASGATVCKHGNRKASSTSGSTDLLEALGVEVELDGPRVARCVDEAGVGFAFARMFHPAMRHAAPVRAELGVPTVFNVLGPLSHPGRVGRQVLGVSDPRLLDLVPAVLVRRGITRAWVVHGSDGLDELTTTDATTVIEVRDGEIRPFEVRPEDVGLPRVTLDDIAVGDPQKNAESATEVFEGRPGPVRDMVVLNAAAALVVADVVDDLGAGVERAGAAIDSGDAARTLGELVAVSRALLSTDED